MAFCNFTENSRTYTRTLLTFRDVLLGTKPKAAKNDAHNALKGIYVCS